MMLHRSHALFISLLLLVHTLHASVPTATSAIPTTRHGWIGTTSSPTSHNVISAINTTASTSSLLSNAENNNTNNSSSSPIPIWKQTLPPPLNTRKTLHRIMIPLSPSTHATVYLLGTSHVSNDSSADVRLLLHEISPDVVFLELCDQRIPLLTNTPITSTTSELPNYDNANNTNTLSFWQKVQQIQSTSGMSRGSAIGTLLLTQVQDDYAESLGVELGGEFKVAWNYCVDKKPIVILGDRPLQITLMRAWESLRWFGKLKVLFGLIWSSLQKPNPEELRQWMQKILQDGDTDVLTESMAELAKSFPSLERVILKERDAYLACKLYQTCQYLDRSRDQTIVAIVGAGHTPGICDWLTNGNGQPPEVILRDRVQTKKWKNHDLETLVQEVTQLPVDAFL